MFCVCVCVHFAFFLRGILYWCLIFRCCLVVVFVVARHEWNNNKENRSQSVDRSSHEHHKKKLSNGKKDTRVDRKAKRKKNLKKIHPSHLVRAHSRSYTMQTARNYLSVPKRKENVRKNKRREMRDNASDLFFPLFVFVVVALPFSFFFVFRPPCFSCFSLSLLLPLCSLNSFGNGTGSNRSLSRNSQHDVCVDVDERGIHRCFRYFWATHVSNLTRSEY